MRPPGDPLHPTFIPAELATLDHTVLDALRPPLLDIDLLSELVTLFLTDAPIRMALLHKAVATGPPLAIAEAAHTLKSASSNLGALRVVVLCNRLEVTARQGDTAAARQMADTIEVELGRALLALRTEVERTRPG
ncbi:MAG TPA: Hpt domain-containing protein [Polyangia bacterium]|jgi:HPt (histidine-containing phosphotransfer) domain-containing protein|nr:Hpt domain-containing protein [Polyangia bacterium]